MPEQSLATTIVDSLFKKTKIPNDGECMFSSIAQSVGGATGADIRAAIIDHLKTKGSDSPLEILKEHQREYKNLLQKYNEDQILLAEFVAAGVPEHDLNFLKKSPPKPPAGTHFQNDVLQVIDQDKYKKVYFETMSDSKTFGTEIELLAYAAMANRPIVLYDNSRQKLESYCSDMTGPAIFLQYDGIHYDTLELKPTILEQIPMLKQKASSSGDEVLLKSFELIERAAQQIQTVRAPMTFSYGATQHSNRAGLDRINQGEQRPPMTRDKPSPS